MGEKDSNKKIDFIIDSNNEMYEVYDYANKLDDKLIKSITSMNDIDLNERINIFKLYKFFTKFSNVNYISLEKNIYSKFNINDKLSIIKFEIDRIGLFIKENGLMKSEYDERYNLIKGTYSLILNDTLSNIGVSEERYDSLLERIALLEFDMNMKLCLYGEITKILCDKIEEITEYKNNLFGNNKYPNIKKKD